MNKNEIYKSLGVIESYIMFLHDKLNAPISDYVMTHLDLLHDWVDKSIIDDRQYDITEKASCGIKYTLVKGEEKKIPPAFCNIHGKHQWYNGKCDYCGKVKDGF